MKIVCLGDSITAAANGWVNILDQNRGIWINEGIAGDTALGMAARLQNQILARKPDGIFLLAGVNDILLTGSDGIARSALMAMVHQCVQMGVKPIVGIPYHPVRPPAYLQSICHPNWPGAMEAYIDWLRELCRVLRLRHVDFDRVVGPELLMDGLHPSPDGHRVMAEEVIKSFGRSL